MKNYIIKFSVSIFLLIAAFFLCLILGEQKITFEALKLAFFDVNSFYHTIIFSLRLPRSILALFSGALLASSGAMFQLFFRNSLAEPGIIGISAGATLGAVISEFVGISVVVASVFGANIFAFFGALFAGLVVTLIAQKLNESTSVVVLLCGTALGTLYSAISSIIILTKSKNLHGIYTWILGSFNGRSWNEVKIILILAVVFFTMLFFIVNKLELLSCGEIAASALGLEVKNLRRLVLIASSFAVSASVCAGGTINFVGLIAPHVVRKIYGARFCNAQRLIFNSAIFGAILVLFSDCFARVVIAPSELPAGLVTSVLGAPFFISLVFSKQNSIDGGHS